MPYMRGPCAGILIGQALFFIGLFWFVSLKPRNDPSNAVVNRESGSKVDDFTDGNKDDNYEIVKTIEENA